MRHLGRRSLTSEVIRDCDALSADLHRRFDEMTRGMRIAHPDPESLLLLALSQRTGIRVDVREQGGEVIVAADLPGVEKEAIRVRLIDPRFLQISVAHREEQKEENGKYHRQERLLRVRSRTVLLPADVTNDGSTSSFRNGVLEIRLKKAVVVKGSEIPVE